MSTGRARSPSLPSVAQVLEFESLSAADPVVVAGAAGLRKTVRWVHVSEHVDIAGNLRGNEMILTTGIALPEDEQELRQYVEALARAKTSAIVVGLGPHFDRSLPDQMMQAADENEIPLIVLRRHTAFVDVTEDVHARLVEGQVEHIQLSEHIHETLMEMVLQGGSPKDTLEHVSRLAKRPAVLETLNHELLEVAEGDRPRNDVIAEWAEHTRRYQSTRRTDYDPRTGWLATVVGLRGDDWARLIVMSAADQQLPRGLDEDPLKAVGATLLILAERAAAMMALGRIVERDRGTLQHQTHRDILSGLLAGGSPAEEAGGVAAAIGFPITSTSLFSVAVKFSKSALGKFRTSEEAFHNVIEQARFNCAVQRVAYLAARISDRTVLILCEAGEHPDAHHKSKELATVLQHSTRDDAIVAHSEIFRGGKEISAGLAGVLETAHAAETLGLTVNPVKQTDLGLEGLLLSLAQNEGLSSYIVSTLSELRQFDDTQGTELIRALRYFLFAGRNKSLAAKRAFVSRPWLYEQLDRVENLLSIDLADEGTCLRLQVAILAQDIRMLDETDVDGDSRPPNA